MLSYEELIYSKEGRIATITLNRPERLNAWTRIMEEEFMTAIRAAADDKSVGCVIVTGAGRGFCAGADIHGWAEGQEQLKIEDEWPPALNTNPSRRASPNVPIALAEAKPVIAAINGPAIGIGLTMALACDIRIASERARFSARFVRVGLIPECGGSRNLPDVAGIETALELALTGRIIETSDPLAQKLVSRIVPHDDLLPEANALATEIASAPTEAVWMTKREIRRNSVEQSLQRVIATVTQLFSQLQDRPAHREAVAAFREKREPQWH